MSWTAEWLYRQYLLQTPTTSSALPSQNSSELKQQRAAVLVPFLQGPNGLELVLTERAAHLKHHPGQISFPGGRIEMGETSSAAALREAEEEIGLPPSQVQLLGKLPHQPTSTGFIIEPWLALIEPPTEWLLQHDEVADLFHAPLQELWQEHRWQQWNWQYQGKQFPVHFLHWRRQLIWGATAAILHRLKLQLGSPLAPE